jgi:hypothetical protein
VKVGEDEYNENEGGDNENGERHHSSSDLYRLNKNSKRWRSMYALRDSLRSLTSCVSVKSNLANKYVLYSISSQFEKSYIFIYVNI